MKIPLACLLQMKCYFSAVRHRPMVHLVLWWLGWAECETQTTEEERKCLARFADGKKSLAEIGVFHGVTTCRLRQSMNHDGVLYAVDPYPRQRLGFSSQRIIARHEVSRIKVGTVKWIRTTGVSASEEIYAKRLRLFDFVFIDGDHSYEGLKADWEGWKKLMTPGGIIALHDSRSTPTRFIDDWGSVRFTREVIERDADFHVVETTDSLTVLKRE